MKFNLKLKSLLKDKNVLRIVAIISFLNLLGYIIIQDLSSVIFFILIGFITTFFSKNMIVVLFTAMILTNFYAISHSLPPIPRFPTFNKIETFKGSSRPHTSSYQPASSEMDQTLAGGSDAALNVDQAATFKEQLKNLQEGMPKGGIKNMNKETLKLLKNQQGLKTSMENLQPMMSESMAMIEKMGGMKGIEGMVDKVEGLLNKFGGGGILGGAKK